MRSEDDEVLKKIIKYCKDIDFLMGKYNASFSNYKSDISFQYACNMCIIQIGELVGRLSADFIEENSQIPWHEIKSMRNIHAHDYDRVDLDIVWNTLCEDIPDLLRKIEEILERG